MLLNKLCISSHNISICTKRFSNIVERNNRKCISTSPIMVFPNTTIKEKPHNVPEQLFKPEQLREFVSNVLKTYNVPHDDAKLASDVLIESDIRGIESHGVARLKTYVGLFEAGKVEPRPEITIVRETPSTATIDGGNGLGLVVGPKANDLAIKKAKDVGSGFVSVRNTNHYGIAGYYVLQSMKHDLIGCSMTNTTPIVVPLGSPTPMLGTNPIAVSFPGDKERGIIADLATSGVAWGKVEIAKRKEVSIPKGWAVDGKGQNVIDPSVVIEEGSLLPLGFDRERSVHKGYCLSVVVDLLCGVLSGANWGPFVPPFTTEIPETPLSGKVGDRLGHFFGALQIEGFRDPVEFKQEIDKYCKIFRASKIIEGCTEDVKMPGDPEWEQLDIRLKEGIPLLQPVIDDLLNISKKTGVKL